MLEEKEFKTEDLNKLLDFNMDEYVYDVQKTLIFYDINILDMKDLIIDIVNDSIAVVSEEVDSVHNTKRSLKIRKDGTASYRSKKNVNLNIYDFIEGLLKLPVSVNNPWVMVVEFLLKYARRMHVNLNREQVSFCVILYNETKYHAVTDDNVEDVINAGMYNIGYQKMPSKVIYDELENLIHMGIVKVDDGKYSVAQKIYF